MGQKGQKPAAAVRPLQRGHVSSKQHPILLSTDKQLQNPRAQPVENTALPLPQPITRRPRCKSSRPRRPLLAAATSAVAALRGSAGGREAEDEVDEVRVPRAVARRGMLELLRKLHGRSKADREAMCRSYTLQINALPPAPSSRAALRLQAHGRGGAAAAMQSRCDRALPYLPTPPGPSHLQCSPAAPTLRRDPPQLPQPPPIKAQAKSKSKAKGKKGKKGGGGNSKDAQMSKRREGWLLYAHIEAAFIRGGYADALRVMAGRAA